MLFRVLYLIALIGLVGHDSGSSSDRPDVDEQRMGGEGFGNVVALVALLGVAILAAIVILAILALAGQFENELIDPVA